MSMPLFKHVQDTSIEAYREIAPTLQARERLVLGWLLQAKEPPTAYELFARMQAAGDAADLNSVRPRLTALESKHVIEKGAKRICRITGKRAYTWTASR